VRAVKPQRLPEFFDPSDSRRVLQARFHLERARAGVTWIGWARRQSIHAAMPTRILVRGIDGEPRTFAFTFGGWVCLGVFSVWFALMGGRS
jgi:hypothetical protein